MSEQPIDAQDLTPGQHVAIPGNPARGDQICRVLYTYRHPLRQIVGVTLLRLADDEVIQEQFTVGESVRLATPEQVTEAEADGQRSRIADGLEQLVRDIRLRRLPVPDVARIYAGLAERLGISADAVGLTYDRADAPEPASTPCPAGRACTGRDGTPLPYACPACGHCSDHAGGCAARTDDGRCGCTGGGAS